MQLSEGKIKHLNALSNDKGVIAAAAMDQRGSLRKAIATAKGVPQGQVSDDMMAEFKVAVSKVLTPHASAILLDPEFGIPAAKARAKNAGLLLAYEESGYDNTKPGRLPDLLPHVSAKRIKDLGADAVKILIYYTPLEKQDINDIKHAFIERIGAECETNEIPFFLEFVGYDPAGGDGLLHVRLERLSRFAEYEVEVLVRGVLGSNQDDFYRFGDREEACRAHRFQTYAGSRVRSRRCSGHSRKMPRCRGIATRRHSRTGRCSAATWSCGRRWRRSSSSRRCKASCTCWRTSARYWRGGEPKRARNARLNWLVPPKPQDLAMSASERSSSLSASMSRRA